MSEIKATMRNQKGCRAAHNDHPERPEFKNSDANNLYWNKYDDGYSTKSQSGKLSFHEAELKFYQERYGDFFKQLEKNNQKEGHSERTKPLEHWVESSRYGITESILQLGKKGQNIDPKILLDCAISYYQWMSKATGGRFQLVDLALHLDEQTPHIHARGVWECTDKNDHKMPCTDRALKEMGIERPNPEKPSGKYNNRKITFDNDIARPKWYDIIEEHGIKIDREVKTPSQKHKKTLEYQVDQEQAKYDELVKKAAELLKKPENLVRKSILGLFGKEKPNISAEELALIVNTSAQDRKRRESAEYERDSMERQFAPLKKRAENLEQDVQTMKRRESNAIHNSLELMDELRIAKKKKPLQEMQDKREAEKLLSHFKDDLFAKKGAASILAEQLEIQHNTIDRGLSR